MMSALLFSRGRGRRQRNAAALAFGLLFLAAEAGTQANAQVLIELTWGGPGSTTTTTDYNLGSNWSFGFTPGNGAAEFASSGSNSVNVTTAVAPGLWIFDPNSQSYSIGGSAVNFSRSGPTGGVINNANAGQTITIANNINDGFSGSRPCEKST